MKVYNARIEQAKYASTAEFFKEKGFALLKNPTKVKEWNDDANNFDNDLTKIYHKEVDELLRTQLFP